MTNRELLEQVCRRKMEEWGWTDKKFQKRYSLEIAEIVAKEKIDYFWNLHSQKIRYPINQRNLLVCKLLGICKDFDIDADPDCKFEDFPDIDVDYLSKIADIREPIREWARKTFGDQYVSQIGTYQTFQIKSTLKDMARVHGKPHEEINIITKDIEDKDEEGKAISWETALRIYPELKEYCDKNPDVATATERLLNRNRGMSVHAGGFIIASVPLTDIVPLVRNKDGPIASAWVEGLHGKDLQPVGLVKYDTLSVATLDQRAMCAHFIKKRHGMKNICALPENGDWSDVDAWRNDKKALAMANAGDLVCIFQFDKDTPRRMAKDGGVTEFKDLVVYTSLNRPGCLKTKMHLAYINRKQGKEPYDLHPVMEPILGKTYGVMVFQEDVMKILHHVGGIPLKDCELVRKAISAKKFEQFAKYEEMFIKNGQVRLEISEKDIRELWAQVGAFAEYGFNKSVLKNTLIPTPLGVKKIEEFRTGDQVYCVNEAGKTVVTEVVALHDHGMLQGFRVTFDDGYEVVCSANHKFLTEKGQMSLREICRTRSSVLCDQQYGYVDTVEDEVFCEFDEAADLGMVSEHAPIADTRNLVCRRVIRVVPVGECHMYDLEVSNPTHNFLLPNGVVTSNSHAVGYTYLSMQMLYMKAHYPPEFYCGILYCEKTNEKFKEYKLEAKRHKVECKPIDVNRSKERFSLNGDDIYFGFASLKGISDEVASEIVKHQPYAGFEDFIRRFGCDRNVAQRLIGLGCFDKDGDPETLMKYVELVRKSHIRTRSRKKASFKTIDKNLQKMKEVLGDIPQSVLDADVNPFNDARWKSYDVFGEIVTYKTFECEENDEGAIPRKVVNRIEASEDVFIERNDVVYLRQEKIVKKRNLLKWLKWIWQEYRKGTEKNRDPHFSFPSLKNFDSTTVKIDQKILDQVVDREGCELMYYGFRWVSDIEKSPDYTGDRNFGQHEVDSSLSEYGVEMQIAEVIKKKTKKGDDMYTVVAEDSVGVTARINVWNDDWERFGPDIVVGNIVRMRVKPPNKGFPTYTFTSPPRYLRAKLVPKNKDEDFRLIVMRKPAKKTLLSHEELLARMEQ